MALATEMVFGNGGGKRKAVCLLPETVTVQGGRYTLADSIENYSFIIMHHKDTHTNKWQSMTYIPEVLLGEDRSSGGFSLCGYSDWFLNGEMVDANTVQTNDRNTSQLLMIYGIK